MILTLFITLTGKLFCNNGNRYEGEFKDDNMHGQGKKSDLLNDLLILTLFNTLTGKFFYNNGDRYEGEFRDDWINGKGKKFDSNGKLIEEGIINVKVSY